MAELYDQEKIYANRPSANTQAPQSTDAELESLLAELPPEEREAARERITAAPTGEDINRAMEEKNANGEVLNMSLDQYRLWKTNHKNKEVDVFDSMGQAAGGVYDEVMKAAGSIYDHPVDSIAKFTPSLVEAFTQGTRNLYGMAAQSADPDSVFFRMKHALSANGSDEVSEYQQFMEAQAFNVHSMRLATGQDTLVMDKDIINPEMTQVMSYIADPTLFVPFGGIAAKGAKLIGMGEALAKASARASVIQRKVLAGTLKWGVGAPIEFMGTAVRNTIDFGLEKAGSAFEVATGMPMAEAQATAKMYGLQTASAALEGRTVGLPVVGNIAGAMVGSTTARGVGEAISAVGEQMGKQAEKGRGVLSYAGQALRDADKSGVPLSKHARALLNVLDKVDPLFVYSADISKGAAEGMAIGAGLGYLNAGEEGAASGAGAGLALGSIGAGAGSLASDIGKTRLYDRIAIQRHLVIEALRKIDPDKASAFEAFAKTAELKGNRDLIAQVDGIITGIDVMAPNSKFVARSEADHMAWLLSQRIDPNTGRLMEPLAMFSEFGTDRKSRAKALSFLSTLGNRFDGDSKKLIEYMKTLPEDHAMRKQFFRLDDKQKKAVFSAIDDANSEQAKKIFGNKKAYEFYGDLNYAEANVARVNAMFDAGNKTQANETIRQFLKDETGKDGKLSARGQLLKDKLATEGYFDKDGNMRPSRLKESEPTIGDYQNAKGFVFRRDSTGQVEIHINLDSFGKETAPHELFHAVMMDSIMKPDFIDRLGQKLLGKFDENGKRIENASVDINQVKKFFGRYIDAFHGKNSEEAGNQNERLKLAMEEYESRGSTKKISLETKDTLEGLLEEFGSYYFGAFVNDKPVDYLFRGGELGAMREIMGGAKQGFLDFWRSKIKGINPDFNFDPATNEFITQAFEKNGVRTKNKSLDLFMRDFVRATAMANRQGGFDITRLSPEARDTFVKNNGIRGLSLTRDANGNLVRSSQRKVILEQMRTGKEIYKILAGLDPKFRQGLLTDGEGNLSGRLSPEAMEAMVQSGHIDKAWVDKIQQAYNILDGKGGNVFYFGYLGKTAQIGDYAWPRLVGSDVPFKNRAAVLLGVDFKVGKDGKMYSLFHTLDKAVIDGRGDVLWSDPAIRTLWGGDRGAMESDFFRYLSNASKAAGDPSRLESAVLLEDGTGAGSRRRDVLHQMLGLVKAEGDVYLNKPIAEIPYGIRHSVTTFNVDGISGMRIGTERWNVVPENAFKDLSRNFQPSEMAREETPNGSIIKHPLGYKFAEKNGKVRSFDDQGNAIGVFDSIQQAADAAGKHSVKQKQELIKATNEQTTGQSNQSKKFQVLERNERDEAVRLGDVFGVAKVKIFTKDTNVIRQSRDEYVLDKAERELVAGSTAFYERLFRAGAEDLLKSFDIDNRMKVAMDNFDAIKQKVEEASAMNDLAYRRGEKTAKQYTQDGEALLAEFKQAMKEKNLVEEQSRIIFNQNTTMLKTFLDMGADGDWKQQIRNGEMPKLTDEGLEKLNDFARKQIEAYRTNNVQGLPETISAHYSDEYNQQFKTGEAFTTIATHGTSSLDLMVAREFKREKLGTTFKIFSSQNAVFSGGQESTGRRYAGLSSSSGTPLELVISNHSPEFVSAKQDLNVYTGYLLDSLINSYFKDTFKPTYEQFKERFKFRTDEAARQAYEMSGNDFVVHDGKLVSKNRLNESLETVVGYKFESEKFKDLLFVVENYHGVKLQEVMKRGDGVKEQEMTNFLRRLIIRDANEKGTPPNTVYNTFGKYSPDATSLADSGGRGAARLISDAYYTLNTAMRTVGYSLDSIGVDLFSVTDPTSKYYEGVRNSVDAKLNRIIAETKTVPMEVRTLVKMKNPLVIEGRKEYGEYFLKDIMEPAMKAGHDGVVFRNMRDGGKYDNIYAVFKDYMDANLMIIDTSFDDVKMPRGNDSEGNPVRYGKELGLRNQPTEGAKGGRVYDQNSNEFKFNFIGKQAEENQDLIQGKNLEFVKRKDGSYRITLTDNGEGYDTRKIGHITATIDDSSVVAGEGVAELSSNIDPKYRGKKLSNILYSEMAERLRSMGIKYVDGTIVNKDGIPVQVRNKVIGQTYYKGNNKPAFREDAAKKVQAVQSVYPSKGIGVYNELDPKARYQPREEVVRRAKEAGYKPTVYYHGTPNQFTEFKSDAGRTMGGRKGASAGYFFFTPLKDEAKGIHGSDAENTTNVMQVFLKYENPFNTSSGKTPLFTEKQKARILDFYRENADYAGSRDYLADVVEGYLDRRDLAGTFKYLTRQKRAELLQSLGYDSLIDKGNHIVVFDPEQIKSADDFTYDDSGKEIPLEERFNKNKKDIRFQPAEYQGGDDYYKKGVKKSSKIPDKYKDWPTSQEGVDEFGAKIRYVRYIDPKTGKIKEVDFPFVYTDIGHEINRRDVWLWSVDIGNFMKYGIHEDTPIAYESMGRMLQEKISPLHGYGKVQASDVRGRIEMPIWDRENGYKLKEKGRVSIGLGEDAEGKLTASDARLLKELVLNGFGANLREQDFDFFLYTADTELRSKFGVSPNDRFGIKFQPKEGTNAIVNKENRSSILKSIQSNAKSVAALKEGQKKPNERTRNYITIDNVNPDLLRDEAVVMHSPDNAGIEPVQIGRFTVQQKGGMRYPIEEFTEGWAANKEGLAKDINDIGDDNAKRGKGWWAPLALIKGIPEKNRGTHTGFEIFLRNIQTLVDKGVLSEESAKNVIGAGFSDADKTLPLDTMADNLLKLSTSNEGKYSITARREAIDVIVPQNLWKELGKAQGIKKLEPHIKGFNSEGITTGADFSTEFLRKMYEASEDPLTKHAKVGEVYGYVIFRSKTVEPLSDKHPSYRRSIAPEQGGKPVQLDILSTPMPARQAFKKKIVQGLDVSLEGATDSSFKGSTGQANQPTARGRFQPSEGFSTFKSERTPTGVLLKNAAGYVISNVGSKFKVYNPYKAVIGIYDSEEQAKKRIYKEEPKR